MEGELTAQFGELPSKGAQCLEVLAGVGLILNDLEHVPAFLLGLGHTRIILRDGG